MCSVLQAMPMNQSPALAHLIDAKAQLIADIGRVVRGLFGPEHRAEGEAVAKNAGEIPVFLASIVILAAFHYILIEHD